MCIALSNAAPMCTRLSDDPPAGSFSDLTTELYVYFFKFYFI